MKKKNQINFNSKVYMGIPYDDLLTFSLYSLTKKNKNITFESLIEEIFILFPLRFSIIGHPEWPDTILIHRSWWRCRHDKKYIFGTSNGGFGLTSFGLKAAEKIQNKLFPGLIDKKLIRIKGDERTKAGRVVQHIERSKAYSLFIKNHQKNINTIDFCDLLLCTPDSLPKVKMQNLEEIRQYVLQYNRDDLKKVLDFCEKKFKAILISEN